MQNVASIFTITLPFRYNFFFQFGEYPFNKSDTYSSEKPAKLQNIQKHVKKLNIHSPINETI